MKYPIKYGYKVSVEIIRDLETDSAYVKVYAPMYMKKEWTFTFCYTSSHFSDYKILNDYNFITEMIKHYRDD